MHLPESPGGGPRRKTEVDMVCKAKPHDMRREIPESQVGSPFGQGRQVHLEVVDGEFPVDIVELKFMLILLVLSLFFGG